MLRYLVTRLLHATAIVAFATIASFVLLKLAPGDASALTVDSQGSNASTRAMLRARYGLDKPVASQVATYVFAVASGDLGTSVAEQRPVRSVLAGALPATLFLSGVGLTLAVVLGLTVGTAQGWRPNNPIASTAGAALTLLYSLPEIIVGIVLLGLFGLAWKWFPVGGMTNPLTELTGTLGSRILDRAVHVILPALTLGLVWSAAIARQQRAAVREIAHEPFVRTARAKGIGPRQLLLRHAVRPSLTGTIALIGTMLPVLAGGTVIVEALYSWPGMGSLLVRSIALRDAPVVAGAVIVIAMAIALGTLAADIVAAWLDPRLRERARP